MITLLIILGIILIILLLRFGVAVKYDDNGLRVWVRMGFISLLVYPVKEHKIKKKKKVKKRKEIMKPGNLDELLQILKPIKNSMSRLKRKLLIKRLKITYIAGGNDPSLIAMSYGTANAVFGVIVPMLEENFRIKYRDINLSADFESEKQKIFLDIVISMAVWESIYVVIALFPILLIKSPDKTNNQKNSSIRGIKENG